MFSRSGTAYTQTIRMMALLCCIWLFVKTLLLAPTKPEVVRWAHGGQHAHGNVSNRRAGIIKCVYNIQSGISPHSTRFRGMCWCRRCAPGKSVVNVIFKVFGRLASSPHTLAVAVRATTKILTALYVFFFFLHKGSPSSVIDSTL